MTIPSFEERFEYLKLDGEVGISTFGSDRYFNQMFYNSREWKSIRREVIIRDGGCDLAIPGMELNKLIFIHHINPIRIDDIERQSEYLMNPEYLICCSHSTHNAIHYASSSCLPKMIIERAPNAICPWRM